MTISRRTFLRRAAFSAGAAAVVFSGFELPRAARAAGAEAFRLKILHSNDHHGRVEPTPSVSISATASRNFGGLARRKTLFETRRTLGGNFLTLDAGDIFQGTL